MRATWLVGLVAVAAWVPPCAAQTVYGAGGLFIHPTALTPPRGDSTLSLSYFTQRLRGARSEWLPASWALSPTDRVQAGAVFLHWQGGRVSRQSGGLFARWQLAPVGEGLPAVALAGSLLAGEVRLGQVSLVASQPLASHPWRGVVAHAGLQWARRADIPTSDEDWSLFGGLEAPMGGGFRLVGEAGTRLGFNRRGALAVGILWSGPPGIRIGIGAANIGRSDDPQFFVGAGYALAAR